MEVSALRSCPAIHYIKSGMKLNIDLFFYQLGVCYNLML